MEKQLTIQKHFLQYRDIKIEEYKKSGCGPSAFASVLSYLGHNVTPQELYDLGLEFNGFINRVGWKHSTLCSLARRYGVSAYSQSFEKYTDAGKDLHNIGIEKIKKSINGSVPVIVSVNHVDRDGSHMIVVSGYTDTGFAIIDSEKDTEEVFEMPYDEFSKRWMEVAIFFF